MSALQLMPTKAAADPHCRAHDRCCTPAQQCTGGYAALSSKAAAQQCLACVDSSTLQGRAAKARLTWYLHSTQLLLQSRR